MKQPDLNDVIDSARERLGGRVRVYTGVDTQTLSALGKGLTPVGGSNELVFKEFAQLCARMALDPEAFYDAASISASQTAKKVERALETLEFLTVGPSGILQWSNATRVPNNSREEIERLLSEIRRARFARSELTETVNVDLIATAENAAIKLAEILRTGGDGVTAVPSISDLNLFLSTVEAMETDLNRFVSLRSLFENTAFSDIAIRRLLEGVDADLDRYLRQMEDTDDSDLQADADALATIAALQVALEQLLTAPVSFGTLLVLEAFFDPVRFNVVSDLVLEPVPEKARGQRTFHAEILEDPGGDPSLRRLRTMASDHWDHPRHFEQKVLVAHDEDIIFLGLLIADRDYSASGSGTVVGDPYASLLVTRTVPPPPGGTVFEDYQWNYIFPDTATLIAERGGLSYAGKAAYVDASPTPPGVPDGYVLLYYNASGTWQVASPGLDGYVDPYGRFEILSTTPMAPLGVEVGTEIQITSPISISREVLYLGHTDTNNSYTNVFGVTLSTAFTVAVGYEFEWGVYTYPGGTLSKIWRFPLSDYTNGLSTEDFLNKVVTLRVGNLWTHRIVTDVQEESTIVGYQTDPGSGESVPIVDRVALTFTFDVPISTSESVYLHKSRLKDFDFPRSPFGKVLPESESEPLDLAPQDRLFVDLSPELGEFDPRGNSVEILSMSGRNVLFDRPVVTSTAFRQDIADRFRTGSTKSSDANHLIYAEGRRIRHLQVGDKVFFLPESADADVPDVSYESVSTAEEYEIVNFTPDGIIVSPSSVSTAAVPLKYSRGVVLPPSGTFTNLYRTLKDDGGTLVPVPIQEIDREVRRKKADLDPDTDFDDVGFEKSLTLAFQGFPIEAQRVGPEFIRISASTSITGERQPAQVLLREETEGFYSTLTVVDTRIVDEYAEAVGSKPSAASANLGSSVITDVVSRRKAAIFNGADPSIQSTPPVLPPTEVDPVVPGSIGETAFQPSTTIRTQVSASDIFQGPITRGGPKPYGAWAWANAYIRRRVKPNFRELREDLGRAYGDLGTNRLEFEASTAKTLTVSAGVAVLSGFAIKSSVTALKIFEGMDVTSPTLGFPGNPTPVRIVTIEADTEDPTPYSRGVVTLNQPVDDGVYDVETFDSSIAKAWRELATLRDYLDRTYQYLRLVEPPTTQFIQASATRLRFAGFEEAARRVELCDFRSWIDPLTRSEKRQANLAQRLDALVQGLVTRRRSPLEYFNE